MNNGVEKSTLNVLCQEATMGVVLGLFHQESSRKIVHFGLYNGLLLLSANIRRESVNIKTAIRTRDELRIYP